MTVGVLDETGDYPKDDLTWISLFLKFILNISLFCRYCKNYLTDKVRHPFILYESYYMRKIDDQKDNNWTVLKDEI